MSNLIVKITTEEGQIFDYSFIPVVDNIFVAVLDMVEINELKKDYNYRIINIEYRARNLDFVVMVEINLPKGI